MRTDKPPGEQNSAALHALVALFFTLCLLPATPCAADAPPAAAKDSGPAKPSVTVSFERPGLRENDSLKVGIWFSNESDQDFTDVSLVVTNPDPKHIEWLESSDNVPCSKPLALQFGPVGAHSIRSLEACLKTHQQVTVGSFNILFTVRYHWKDKAGKLLESAVSAEKPLQVNLLGTESLGGVPLALAGLIVPGLLFWFFVGKLKPSWDVGTALGDKLIYSVLVSVGFVAFAEYVLKIDVTRGVGLAILGYLALAGGVLGLLVGGAGRLNDWRRKRKEQELTPKLQDAQEPIELLWKVLKRYPTLTKPRMMVRVGDAVYVGSLGMQTQDKSTTVVVGWFGVSVKTVTAELRERITKLIDERHFAEAHRLASQAKAIQPQDTVKQIVNGHEEDTGSYAMGWTDPNAELRIDDSKAPHEPLRVLP